MSPRPQGLQDFVRGSASSYFIGCAPARLAELWTLLLGVFRLDDRDGPKEGPVLEREDLELDPARLRILTSQEQGFAVGAPAHHLHFGGRRIAGQRGRVP